MRRTKQTFHWLALTAAAAVGTLASRTASAQPQGFAVDRFDPAERGSEWFTTDTLALRGNVRPAFGIGLDYAYRPLIIRDPNAESSVGVSTVRDQLYLHPGGSLVLWDRVRAGFNLPIALQDFGHTGVAPGSGETVVSPPNEQALGDLRLGVDVKVLGNYGDAFTGAVGVQVYLPTGKREAYTGDETVRLQPRLLVAGDIGPFVYAARLQYQYRPHDTPFRVVTLGSEVAFGASAGARVADGKLVIGPEFSISSLATGDFFKTSATPAEAILGAHYTAGDFRFGAGGGLGLTKGYGSPWSRWLASVEWAPGVPSASDRDGDGIPDTEDACPDEHGLRTDDPKTNGCPPPSDRDGDGVLDKDDACPDVPGVKTDDPKTNGCPADRDHDGIPDSEDACPDVPGVRTADPKTNGCPADRDHDGIPDSEDACPDVPGKPSADPKKNGCPEAFVQAGQIMIMDQVKFKTNSAEILGKDSEDVLAAVAKVLADHPEIKKVRVEGHTDDVGNAPYNKKLSESRAQSVVKWLTAHGVDAAHLSAQGFGQEKPIDDNKTEDGRKNNRRVEFHIE